MVETPNPECLAIFATHFYIDPTHTKPIPPVFLRFILKSSVSARLRRTGVFLRPSRCLRSPDYLIDVQRKFFGSLDYAITGRSCKGGERVVTLRVARARGVVSGWTRY